MLSRFRYGANANRPGRFEEEDQDLAAIIPI
jgi:hypothetical protein